MRHLCFATWRRGKNKDSTWFWHWLGLYSAVRYNCKTFPVAERTTLSQRDSHAEQTDTEKFEKAKF